MKLTKKLVTCFAFLIPVFSTTKAQLYKIELTGKINKASLIVEGTVTEKHSFWNDAHTLIYTSNTIHVYKLFKGNLISADIEVITQGGTVGSKCLKVSDVLQLEKGETGMFFLYENALKIRSPKSKKILFDVYSSSQGFLRYDRGRRKAFAPFAKYENIQQTLYSLINQHTGIKEKIIDNAFKPANSGAVINGSDVSNGTEAVAITSFSPATVHPGAINDEPNNILTINGSGFGNNPSALAGVLFKDANNNNAEPDYEVAFNSPYIISWTDAKIQVRVPDRAGEGKFSVVASDGTEVTSATNLKVLFSIIDASFKSGDKNVIREPRLMNTNNNGGYSVQYSTSTAGKGVDFTTSPAKAAFQRALATWKEIAGANIIEGTPTTFQTVADDDINLVVFDNNNSGVAHMADGVLESTYSWFSACTQNGEILVAQKTGFDIILRNDKVSTGDDIDIENGPCFPVAGSYDIEMIILHELGHALNLSHINDDYENGGGGYPTINPSKLMHYAILDYVDRRSPDASSLQGGLYTITPQHNVYGSCGLYAAELVPLQTVAISNDECPSGFPSTAIGDNTLVNFDLTHATSNKFTDPSYKQVTCNNSGTSVTNNAYYAFTNGSKRDLELDITNYTATPEALNACTGQATRLALYDVQSCPEGQSYPSPVFCKTFTGNDNITIPDLAQNHKYLLYFDGIRNTKASFNVTFNGDGSNPGTSTTVEAFPNPVSNGITNIRITNASGSFYEYALFDMTGKLVTKGKVPVIQPVQTFKLNIINVVSGVYHLRIMDENGKTIAKKKIVKYN